MRSPTTKSGGRDPALPPFRRLCGYTRTIGTLNLWGSVWPNSLGIRKSGAEVNTRTESDSIERDIACACSVLTDPHVFPVSNDAILLSSMLYPLSDCKLCNKLSLFIIINLAHFFLVLFYVLQAVNLIENAKAPDNEMPHQKN